MSDQQPAPAPTAPVLESMNVGMILDKAIHLYARDFLLLVAITAIPSVVYSVASSRIQAATTASSPFAVLGSLVMLILSTVLYGIAGGAMTVVVSSRYLGRHITFGAAYGAAFRKSGPIVGAKLLAALLIGLGFMGLIVPGIILALSYTLISPVIMLEQIKATESPRRSRLLMKGYRWQALLLFLVYGVVLYPATYLFGRLASAIVATTGGGLFVSLVSHVLVMLTTVLLGPFSSVLSVLIYYNQRIKKESFDLAFLAEAMAHHSA